MALVFLALALLLAPASATMRGVCAVEDYGAVADGTTDCSAAVLRALNDCAGKLSREAK